MSVNLIQLKIITFCLTCSLKTPKLYSLRMTSVTHWTKVPEYSLGFALDLVLH